MKDIIQIQVQLRGWAMSWALARGWVYFLQLDFGVWRAKSIHLVVEQDGNNSHKQERI